MSLFFIEALRRIRDIPFIYAIYVRTLGIPVMEYKRRSKIKSFQKNGKRIAAEYMGIADKNNIKVMCVFGTLLGVVRDNGFIPFDFDFDTAIMDTEKRKDFVHALYDNGFSINRQFLVENKLVLQTWQKDGVIIDMFIPQYDDQGMYFNTMWRFPNKQYHLGTYEEHEVWEHRYPKVDKLKVKHIYNFNVLIPENEVEVVEGVFGKGWRTPDPDFKHEPLKSIKMVKEDYYVDRDKAVDPWM